MKNKKLSKYIDIFNRCKFILFAEILFFCFLSTGYAEIDVTLKWTINSEPDFAGYYIYYKVDPDSDYENKFDVYNPSDRIKILPSDANDIVCKITLPESSEGGYFFVVTAYDNSRLESGYSNEEYFRNGDDVDIYRYRICNENCADTENVVQEIINNCKIGRNKMTTLAPHCCSYTSFKFLLDSKGLGNIVNLHLKDSTPVPIKSTYWFFGQVCGEKVKFFCEPFTEEVMSRYIIDKLN